MFGCVPAGRGEHRGREALQKCSLHVSGHSMAHARLLCDACWRSGSCGSCGPLGPRALTGDVQGVVGGAMVGEELQRASGIGVRARQVGAVVAAGAGKPSCPAQGLPSGRSHQGVACHVMPAVTKMLAARHQGPLVN